MGAVHRYARPDLVAPDEEGGKLRGKVEVEDSKASLGLEAFVDFNSRLVPESEHSADGARRVLPFKPRIEPAGGARLHAVRLKRFKRSPRTMEAVQTLEFDVSAAEDA